MAVLPDQLPLRAAAHAIRGCKPEGRQDGHAIFSWPAAPETAQAVVDTFSPTVRAADQGRVGDLLNSAAALAEAARAKHEGPAVPAGPMALRTTPMEHQVRAFNFVLRRWEVGAKGSALLMQQGCVDASTEYLSPTGWRRMDGWDGGTVAQYHPDTGRMDFVTPTDYVVRPCESMIRFKADRGSDQLLSPGHRMLVRNSTPSCRPYVRRAEEIEAKTPNARRFYRIPTTFEWAGGAGMNMAEPAMRLQIAVMADGHFPNSTNRCVMRLKRQRKIERLRSLLEQAGVEYRDEAEPATGFRIFSFQAPQRWKSYGSEWWSASANQLRVIASEVLHWDGTRTHCDAFFSTDKASADFIQFVFASQGRRASLRADKRVDRATCYTVILARKRSGWCYLPKQVWRERPEDNQMYCFEVPSGFLVLRRNGYIFCTGNTGKSLVAVAAGNWLRAQRHIGWGLILCPNSLRGTWAADDGEVATHSEGEVPAVELRGTREQRVDQLERELVKAAHGSFRWLVLNYDTLALTIRKRGPQATLFKRLLDTLEAGPPGLLVCDESTAVKSHSALRTATVLELAKRFPYRLILTGTPLTKAPLDLYSQLEVVEEGSLGHNSYLAFERAYMIRERVRTDSGEIREVCTYRNLDDLARRVDQVAFRVLARDCMDLPPVTVKRVPVQMSPEQGRLLAELKRERMALLEEGLLVDGRNILTRLGKSAEVVGGYVGAIDLDGKRAGVQALTPNPKLEALTEYLDLALAEDPERKVVVFCKHTAEVVGIVEALAKYEALPFYGAVKPAEREVHRQRFRDPADPARVLVCQYQCGSKGLNLTVADTIVFYSPTFSFEDYDQARKRVDRKGQTRPVTELHLLGRVGTKRTVDYTALDAVRNKRNLADVVTGDNAVEPEV